MNLTVRRSLAAAAVSGLIAVTSACSGDESSGSGSSGPAPTPSPTSASSAPETAEPTPAESNSAGGGAAAGEPVSAEKLAAMLQDALAKATTAHLTMTLGEGLGTAEGDADFTDTPPSMALSMTLPQLGGEVETRMVDGTIYVKSPAFGNMWLSMALGESGGPLGDLGAQFDVAEQLEKFAGAVSGATYLGVEDVDGESLHHYSAEVDTVRFLDALPGGGDAGSAPTDPVTQDWWFDDEGRIREFSATVDQTTVSVKLSDWGKDVSIQAPPPNEVTKLPSMGAPSGTSMGG